MDEILNKKRVQILTKPEDIYPIELKNEVQKEEVEVQEAHKKLNIFAKHKKIINIEKIKGNMDANVYRNRFVRY